MLSIKTINLRPRNVNDNHPIKVIKNNEINISNPGMLYGK